MTKAKSKILTRLITLLFAAVLALGGLWYINRVLVMKRADGILTMQSLYAQPEGTVDVLFVGNSHSGINIDTAALWENSGISSYNLWGGVQPLWNSYHFIVEALKYQTPKVIVLEVTATVSDYEYSEEQNQLKNIAGMKLSKNKLEAVKVSAPEDRRLDLLLGLPLYHSRFDELTKKDFEHFPWSDGIENFKGSYLLYGTGSYPEESAEGVTERGEIMEKELEYLNKIIALCRDEDIPLVLLKTPTVEREDEQKIFNTVADIADDSGLPFINMNLMDDELDIGPSDFSADRHMNGSGARKVARWLGEYLSDNYALSDHRGDEQYQSWEINAHTVNGDYLASITDTADYFTELRQNGVSLLIVKNSPWEDNDAYRNLAGELESVGLHEEMAAEDEKNAFLIADTSAGEHAAAAVDGDAISFDLDGKMLTVSFEYEDVVLDGKKLCWFGADELTLIAYDTVTHKVIDTVTFNSIDDFSLTRADETE